VTANREVFIICDFGAAEFIICDFGAAEFALAVARRVRTRDLTPNEARIAPFNFDSWVGRSTDRQGTTTPDIAAAGRFDVNLRTPDAEHIGCRPRSKPAFWPGMTRSEN
jgi:hypothetical protein